MEKVLIILRGLPGSGKTTLAPYISEQICCADDFFINVRGEYVFDVKKLGEAHNFSIAKCRLMMAAGHPKIVIANTNVTDKEMEPYEELAKIFRYKIFHVIVENRHGGKTAHDVPEQAIEKRKKQFSIKL